MNDRIIDLIVELKKKCAVKEEDIQQEFDLSQAEYRGVVTIDADEKIACSEFSQRMNLSPSRGSRIIEKMIDKGFINYGNVPSDRRTHLISLTPKGRRVKRKVDQKKDECEQAIRDHYSDTQIDALKKSLSMLVGAL